MVHQLLKEAVIEAKLSYFLI